MSSDKPLEFFLDRSLGKRSAAALVEAGWVVHFIADLYGDDAADIPDEEWIADGCSRGWILLTKDKRIRYRSTELAALQDGHLFCLARGDLTFDQMGQRLLEAGPAIARAVKRERVGFWHVLDGGRVVRKWP
jgi:hypothetical protein